MSQAAVSSRKPSPPVGVLSAGGDAMMHVLACTASFPTTLPDRWRDLAAPVRDNRDRLIDWRLRPGVNRDTGALAAEEDEFRSWRAQFQTERLIGDVATVRAFLDWAVSRLDVSALHPLRLAEGRIDPHDLSRAAWQASKAAALCRASGDLGVGVFAAHRDGMLRGFDCSQDEVTVLANDAATVRAVAEGLRVTCASHDSEISVTGWQLNADGVQLTTTTGESVQADHGLARLLGAVSIGVSPAAVRPVPLSRVFSGVTSGIAEIARLGDVRHTPLLFSTGPRITELVVGAPARHH